MLTAVQEFEAWQKQLIDEAARVKCPECKCEAHEDEMLGEYWCENCGVAWWEES